MGKEARDYVWKHSKQKGTALLMLLALAELADSNGVCYPGVDYLAEKARVKERNAQITLQNLVKAGELSISKRDGKTNLYTIIGVGVQPIAPPQPIAQVQTQGVQSSAKRGAISHQEGCNPAPKGVQPIAPEPLEPNTEPIQEPKAKAAHTPAHEATASAAAVLPSKAVEVVEPAPETTVVLPSGKEAAQVESQDPLQSSAKVSPGETEPESPITLVFREYSATFGLPKSDLVRIEVQDAVAEYGADEVIEALIYSRERAAYSFRHTLTRLAARKLDAQRAAQSRILPLPTRRSSITAPPPMRSPDPSRVFVEDDGHIPAHLTPEWEKMFGKYGVTS